jgi:exopolyphosphatase / guanosine-5'-triphosphate,3'-diphosphate pyrophosphatase
MWRRHHGNVPTGVVDVGSNTVRLHVAHDGETVFSERTLLGLGEAVERYGAIPEGKLAEAAACVAGYVEDARNHGADRLEVLVTSPGRQASNGVELVRRLEGATDVPVRLLTAIDEARLGFAGGLAVARVPPGRSVAVVDVGGGSAQIAVGTRRDGPTWMRSIDIGSIRLTRRCVSNNPPTLDELSAMRTEVARYLSDVTPPQPRVALAVGGSARNLRKVAETSRLGPGELAAAIDLLQSTPATELMRRFDVDPGRVRTLLAGAVILEGIRELLGTGFRVVRSGVREGAVLELESRSAAA